MRVLLILIFSLITFPASAFAQTWLWAWDRPEDLRWVESQTGVAFFAAQFEARDDRFIGYGRRAVLRVRPDTPLKPVIHIEAFYSGHPPVMNDQAVSLWADELTRAIKHLGSKAVQIDFEARSGQRDFYAAVLRSLRRQLSPDTHLSITALASWCGDPAWLNSLPVDEVVPMYFRMGPSERQLWRQRLLQPESLPKVCRSAAGIATDEWEAISPIFNKVSAAAERQHYWYLFAPKSWKPAMLNAMQGWAEFSSRDLAASTRKIE